MNEERNRRLLSPQARASLLALGAAAVLLAVGLIYAQRWSDMNRAGDEVAEPQALEMNLEQGEGEAPQIQSPEIEATETVPAWAEEEAVGEPDFHAESGNDASAPEGVSENGQAEAAAPRISLSRLSTGGVTVVRAYGYDFDPNTEDYRFHRGCDLAAASGQPLFAPADGVVLRAEEDAYWGGVLILRHEGWNSILRCVTPRVSVGDRVLAGDFIASVASSPAEAVEDSHFHIEVEVEGQSQDPSVYL